LFWKHSLPLSFVQVSFIFLVMTFRSWVGTQSFFSSIAPNTFSSVCCRCSTQCSCPCRCYCHCICPSKGFDDLSSSQFNSSGGTFHTISDPQIPTISNCSCSCSSSCLLGSLSPASSEVITNASKKFQGMISGLKQKVLIIFDFLSLFHHPR
jgi:hypothetical protein